MITLRKLASLPLKSRARKLREYWKSSPGNDPGFFDMTREVLGEDCPPPPTNARELARLILALERFLGLPSVDWDDQSPPDRPEPSRRFPLVAFLEDLRSPFNVGSILRTAEALGFERVILSPLCPALDHPRLVRTAMGAQALLPVERMPLERLRDEWAGPVWALELGGTPLPQFAFPPSGLMLVGHEEWGLSPEALQWAQASAGRSTIPLPGQKASLNVGVAFGIAAARWVETIT